MTPTATTRPVAPSTTASAFRDLLPGVVEEVDHIGFDYFPVAAMGVLEDVVVMRM